ncbi:hypothetical protein RRF57_011590 [Xylaria bambusicola]|uniref:Uncharacterized protein n=1 Tax=Xylaria bambusicola TaxID=326684 RepID=A0AAN7UV64_9PEZI
MFGVCSTSQSQFCARNDDPEAVSQPRLVQPSLGTLAILLLPPATSVKRPKVISLRMLRASMSRNVSPAPSAMPLISSRCRGAMRSRGSTYFAASCNTSGHAKEHDLWNSPV